MNMLIGALIVCSFSLVPAFKAEAELDPDLSRVSYVFSDLKLVIPPVPRIQIDHASRIKTALSLSMISTAEAAVPPDQADIRAFEKICNAISNAARIDDLKPFLVDKNIEFLKARVKAGVSGHVVLAMLQVTRPRNIRIIDSRVEDGRGEFAVSGYSTLGLMQGKIHMVKADGAWKIEDETWFASERPGRSDNLIVAVYKSLSDPYQYMGHPRKGFVSGVSSEDAIREKPFQLTRISNHRRKQAIMFVFFMDKAKGEHGQPVVGREDRHSRMHVLGPKKVFPRPEVIDDKYPLDISVARYDEGYAPEELNLVVPNGKPREVAVSWLWSF